MLVKPSIDNLAFLYDKMVLPSGGQVLKGIVGVTKSVLNVDVLEPEEIMRRRDICYACENKSGVQCSKCACIISLKTRLKKEICPIGKW